MTSYSVQKRSQNSLFYMATFLPVTSQYCTYVRTRTCTMPDIDLDEYSSYCNSEKLGMDCDGVSNDDIYISISSPDTIRKSSSRVSNEHGTPVCVLTIPNQLLLNWNDSNTTSFVSKANDNIINEIVTLRQEKRLENVLASHARTINSPAKKMRSGSKRHELLQKYTHVLVMAGETISIQEVINENEPIGPRTGRAV